MNELISWLMFGVVATGWVAYGRNPPDKAVSPVGQEYCARVVNRVEDTVGVFIVAPRTDSAVRPIGILMPRDSGVAVLPYHIPPVMLIYLQVYGRGGWWTVVPPDSILPCRRVGP